MVSAETVGEAKLKLQKAIQEYYGTVGDDVFVTSWVVIAHKASTSLAKDGQSAVGYIVPNDQYFPVTIGLLTVASDAARGRD